MCRTREAPILIITITILLMLSLHACKSFASPIQPAFTPAEVTQIVPVTRVVPITQIALVTRIVPVTQIAVVTQIEVAPILAPQEQVVAPPAFETPPPPVASPTPPAVVIPLQNLPDDEGLIFNVGHALYWTGLDGAGGIIQIAWLPDARQMMAVDPVRRHLYLVQWDAGIQLIRANQDNLSESIYIQGPDSGGQGLALDIEANRFFLGTYYGGVYAAQLDSCCSNWQTIVNASQLSPTYGQRGQLQLDSPNRQIYFRTTYDNYCPECRYIWRVNYDGSNLQPLIPANSGDALALDLVRRKMYFSDIPYEVNTIKRANLDGSNPEVVLTLIEPFSYCREMAIDTEHKRVYLSLYGLPLYQRRVIASMNLDGSDFRILFDAIGNDEDDVTGGIALYLNP